MNGMQHDLWKVEMNGSGKTVQKPIVSLNNNTISWKISMPDNSIDLENIKYISFKIFNINDNININKCYVVQADNSLKLVENSEVHTYLSNLKDTKTVPQIIPSVPTLAATPTSSKVYVDGKDISFDAYNIEGSNYFKLRDLAFSMKGTAKQFDVSWDGANNAINLLKNKPYTVTNGEMSIGDKKAKAAIATSSKILLDGKEIKLTAYNIDGNNYFKLRDIGETFNFNVTWDGENNAININTGESYEVE